MMKNKETAIVKQDKELTPYQELSRKHRLFIDNLIIHKFNLTKAYQDTYPQSNEDSARANVHRLIAKESIEKALKYIVSEGWVYSKFINLSTNNKEDIVLKAVQSIARIKGMYQDKPQILQQFNIDTHNTDKEIIDIIHGK